MSENPLIEELLDDWEEWRGRNPRLPLDQFIFDHCAHADTDVLAPLREMIEKLSGIDVQLQILGSPPLASGKLPGDANSEELKLADLVPGCNPVPGYTLISKLGVGGFGEVWKATGPGDFPVALKFIVAKSHSGQIEGRSLAVIRDVRHPHLLSVFGTWQIGDLLVIATELADRTLLDRFHEAKKQGYEGIPVDELLRYMDEAAKGLDYLNEPVTPGRQRIQHRDVKPQNLLLSGGCVKIGDFGLARSVQFDVTGHTGSLTLAYAAPECLDGSTSHRSDQYSLAVTYCYLRSGHLPFNGTPVEIIDGHRKKRPDLSNLPERERPPVARSLAKSPKDRWANCTEFLQELRSTVEGKKLSGTKNATSSMKIPRTTWIIVVSLLLLLSGIGFELVRSANKKAAEPQGGEQTVDRTSTPRPLSADTKHSDAQVTLAVMDFDNHSGDPSLDGFRLGFRDMLVTDLSRVTSIRVLERAQLAALLKEHDLAATPFIDPKVAVKLGRGLSARVMLSGSFAILGDSIRIDVRMVDVETSEVLLAEAVGGKKADIFGLQHALATHVVKGLKITLSDAEQAEMELPKTPEFEAFRLYSEARLARIKGQREQAEQQYRESLAKDPTFALASRELAHLEAEALARLTDEQKNRTLAAGEVGKRLQDHFLTHQRIVENGQVGPEYLASLLLISIHAGLSGDHDREFDLLIAYWRCFIEDVQPDQALAAAERVRTIIVREGKFFQENIDSGDYGILLPGVKPEDIYLTHEIRGCFSWPKWSVIWPFNVTLRHPFGFLSGLGKADEKWFDNHLPKYPHDYLKLLLNPYSFKNNDHDHFIASMQLETSILQFYSRVENKPETLSDRLQDIEDSYLRHLKGIQPEEWDTSFLVQAVATLEMLGKTAARSEDRDTANRLIVRFSQQLRINTGVPTDDEQSAMTNFCSLAIKGSPVVFVWNTGSNSPIPSFNARGAVESVGIELTDFIRSLPQSTSFNICWAEKTKKDDSITLFDEARSATPAAKKKAIDALKLKRISRKDSRSMHGTIDGLIRELGSEACVVIVAPDAHADIPESTLRLVEQKQDAPRVFAVISKPTNSLARLVEKTGGTAVQTRIEGGFRREVNFVPWDVSTIGEIANPVK